MAKNDSKDKNIFLKAPIIEGTVLHQYITAKELATILRKSTSFLYQLEAEHPRLCTPVGKLHRSRIYHPRQVELILMCYEGELTYRDDQDNWKFGEQLWYHYKAERFRGVTKAIFESIKSKEALHIEDEQPTRANLMEYRNYIAEILYNPKRDCLQGQIIGIDDEIIFYGTTISEMHSNLRAFVRDYVKACKKSGATPQKSFSGQLNLRIGSRKHRSLVLKSRAKGKSTTQYVLELIERDLIENPEELPTGIYKSQ